MWGCNLDILAGYILKEVRPTFWGEANPTYKDGESNQRGHKKKCI